MINIREIRRIPRTTMRSYGDDAIAPQQRDDAIVRYTISRQYNEAWRRNKTLGGRGVIRLSSIVRLG